MTPPSPVRALRARLLAYYDAHARDLPWRRTRDPYRIWVSEVMLQQTRVAVVTQRYERFLARFPDVASLARASAETVLRGMGRLGYYSRARNLHAAARAVERSPRRRMPESARGLAELPGIGAYTAGAVASIAFGERVPAVDGNAERVLARLLAHGRRKSTAVSEIARALVDCERPGDVNQALMDLGAVVCTARTPRCAACPLGAHCRGRALGAPERFPAKRARPSVAKLDVVFAWIPSGGGVWLERRPLAGLWSGLWQLPAEEGPRARGRLAERLGVDLGRVRVRVHHALTHRSVEARVYVPSDAPHVRRRTLGARSRDPLAAPLSALARKAIVAMRSRAASR
jgi:A/G-specific adenine glycosylase